MFGQEYMFLIGVRILSGTVTARQAGEAFARLADAVIRAVHRAVAENFAGTYGHMRGEETAVLAHGQARRPRDDRDLRSRSHPGLRFRRGRIRNPTAAARSTARNISRG